jgi:solute carrier family 8 (sodium/calcium exchanger)
MGGTTGGVFLPLGGNWDREIFGQYGQVAIVFSSLMYCFVGVAFVADVFMAAIEKITSKKVRMEDENGKMRTFYLWNPTVANLTLMALGSSAPEILLSVIELVSNQMQSGELGPSTIVGSAAFNLHVILAVCVVVIPSGESRAIKEIAVFGVTASFSVFAYVWLFVILKVTSPHVVEAWEGIMTFMFFPVLCILAFAADKGYIHRLFRQPFHHKTEKLVLTSESTKQEKEMMMLQIQKKYGKGQDVKEHMEDLMHYEFDPRPSRAQLRMQATRDMFKGKPLPFKTTAYQKLDASEATAKLRQMPRENRGQAVAKIGLASSLYMVKESDKQVVCEITRTGDIKSKAKVRVKTRDGTAKAGDDYEAVDEDLWFFWNQKSRKVTIKIFEDSEYEETEDFYVTLSVPQDQTNNFDLTEQSEAKVLIFDNNHPGVLRFDQEDVKVHESCDTTKVEVKVMRTKGCYGPVKVDYHTEDMSAKGGFDYYECKGQLEFAHGESTKTIMLEVLPKGRSERTEQFRLIIDNPQGGVMFDRSADGDDGKNCICTITVEGDPEQQTWLTGIVDMVTVDPDTLELGAMNWGEQFLEIMKPEGTGAIDILLYVLLFPWKFVSACIPPPSMCDGWVCFVSALCVIGALTAVIGDLAGLLGCALEIPASITAVTIVALGTSLPDTFASKTAAVSDPTADNSIGNVTGSNSVNVFLGLGLPWMIGALYWNYVGVKLTDPDDPWRKRGEEVGWWNDADMGPVNELYPATFVVPAGSLGGSVAVFTFGSLIEISILMARRRFVGAELGGDDKIKWVTAAIFVCLWLMYVVYAIITAGE